MATSNHLIGFLNFLTFLLSIPILGGGIWLSSLGAPNSCIRFLQWPFILAGAAAMAVSLAGFVGACYRNTFLMYLYLWAMFFVVAALIGFVIFAYSVTSKGSGRAVMGRAYMDYSFQDYMGSWLAGLVASPKYWPKIESCVRESGVCRRLGRAEPEPAQVFYLRRLSPIESGCCKPPTSCGYTYINETFWAEEAGPTGPDLDCFIWSNEQDQLCYNCGSCRAGVVASLQKSWRKVSVIYVVILIILVVVYVIACGAFRHNRQLDNNEPNGEARMVKARPSRLPF